MCHVCDGVIDESGVLYAYRRFARRGAMFLESPMVTRKSNDFEKKKDEENTPPSSDVDGGVRTLQRAYDTAWNPKSAAHREISNTFVKFQDHRYDLSVRGLNTDIYGGYSIA